MFHANCLDILLIRRSVPRASAADAPFALVHSLDQQGKGTLRKRQVDTNRQAAWMFLCTTELVKVR